MPYRPLLMALALLAAPAVARAQGTYFDLQSGTAGTSATFNGVIGSSAVNVSIGSNPGTRLRFNTPTDTTPGVWGQSTVDGTSPQYRHATYTDPITATDRIGYSKTSDTIDSRSRVTITFSVPVTNLRFHVANLDLTHLDFTSTAVVTSLTRLSGNGGADGDGFDVSGKSIVDLDVDTFQTSQRDPNDTPLGNGTARSAYGSAAINASGPISTLTFDFVTRSTANATDNGSFTFSATPVPEPATVLAVAAVGLAGWRRWRR